MCIRDRRKNALEFHGFSFDMNYLITRISLILAVGLSSGTLSNVIQKYLDSNAFSRPKANTKFSVTGYKVETKNSSETYLTPIRPALLKGAREDRLPATDAITPKSVTRE